jgi:DNA adenine methylase
VTNSEVETAETVTPPIKWPGGKRWLMKRFPGLLNIDQRHRFFEPFLGGAAVFAHYRPRNAVLSDLNAELIGVYGAMREDPEGIVRRLWEHQMCHDREYYYRVRSITYDDPVDAAARFIYLNRTCFNGIYRVNQRGEFNVPIGSRNSVIFDSDDFVGWSRLLKQAEIRACDFEESIASAWAGDFVFADPPYVVKHNLNGFRKYNEALFSWSDQERLARVLCDAAERGVRVVATNANHPSVSLLYPKIFRRTPATRGSCVAGLAAKRGTTEELILWTEGAVNELVLRES